jgi:hypothetical protein
MLAVNDRVAGGFSVILVLTGIFGFLLPPGPMSNAPAYNAFHIVFGALGLALFATRRTAAVRAFNIVFGLIDLYQAGAHRWGLFPIAYFRWTRVDDALHLAIGAALVAVGIFFKD